MTEDAPLSRKIDKLVAQNTFAGNALELGAAGDLQAVDLILDAIDDTMMFRDAVFAVGVSAVTLRVSGKRVLKLTAATEDLKAPDALLQAPLSADQEEALAALALILQRLSKAKGTLTLTRLEVDQGAAQSGSGVGIASLRAAIDANRLFELPEMLEAFVEGAKELSDAISILCDGKVERQFGDQPQIDDLQALLAETWPHFRNSGEGVLPSANRSHILVTDAMGDQGIYLFSVISEDYQIFGSVSPDVVARILGIWAKAQG
ncbi:MAG: hypothetical protein AAF943_04645 [Pseudomonadota bacterium]